MGTTPLWVPLVVAILGLFGTVTGVLVTQRRSDRREVDIWNREREREREAWNREDRLRTFDQRRQAYVDFVEALEIAENEDAQRKSTGEKLSEQSRQNLWIKSAHVEIFGTEDTRHLADAALHAFLEWVRDDTKQKENLYIDAFVDLTIAIREDLGIDVRSNRTGLERESLSE